MSEIYTSTKALSVYNALSLTKQDLARDEVEDFLLRTFDQNLSEGYVDDGVAYLLENNLASEQGGKIVIPRLADGRGKPVVRSGDDRNLVRASY